MASRYGLAIQDIDIRKEPEPAPRTAGENEQDEGGFGAVVRDRRDVALVSGHSERCATAITDNDIAHNDAPWSSSAWDQSLDVASENDISGTALGRRAGVWR